MPNYNYNLGSGQGQIPTGALAAYGIGGVVVTLVVLVFALWIYGRILHKAGYSGWLALLMLIPLVNLILILWFAFATWPVEKRAAAAAVPQAPAGYYPPQQPAAPMQQPAPMAQQPPMQQPTYAPPQPPVPQPPAPQPPAPMPPEQPGGYTPPPQQ